MHIRYFFFNLLIYLSSYLITLKITKIHENPQKIYNHETSNNNDLGEVICDVIHHLLSGMLCKHLTKISI